MHRFLSLALLLILACIPSGWAAERMYVRVESANVRSGPDGEIIGNLERGTAVEVHDHSGPWSRISVDYDVPEWIHSSLLCSDESCSEPLLRSELDTRSQLQPSSRRSVAASTSDYRPSRTTIRTPNYSTTKRPRRDRSTHNSSGSCPCSGHSNCIGPRGGRYCITSGGNKRYR
jgi:uncharacterized protein YgiM (DUF1202 family)